MTCKIHVQAYQMSNGSMWVCICLASRDRTSVMVAEGEEEEAGLMEVLPTDTEAVGAGR